jgi:uncharacterized membrane protein
MSTFGRWCRTCARWVFLAVMGLGVGLMVAASTSYLELGKEHPFFLEKLPLTQPNWWWLALCAHVPSALFCLPACLLLLMRPLRVRLPRFHRWLGRVTGLLVLGAVVPSGMYLACFATGGLVSTLGFWLTGAIAAVAMVKSATSARRRDYRTHRRFSLHVTGQLSVAVSSRLLLVGAEELGLYADWVYVSALWLPVLGSVLFVECASGRLRELLSSRRGRVPPPANKQGSRHENVVVLSQPDPLR